MAFNYFSDHNLDTQIYTGIVYDACFQATVIGALKKGITVYACIDATDCPADEIESFSKSLKDKAIRLRKGYNLTVTNISDITNVLLDKGQRGLSPA